MKTILNNGAELDALVINGASKYFQGAIRDTLEFQFAKSATTFEQLDTLFGNTNNTCKITLFNDGTSYLHENYSLRMSMGFAPVMITPATDSTPEVTEDRFTVIMAQKTYAEKQLESTAANTLTAMEGLAEVYEELVTKGVI